MFLIQTRKDWELTRLEVSDGFYHPVCFIMRVVMDHFTVAVVLSFVVVGVTQIIFWPPFINGEAMERSMPPDDDKNQL